MRAKKLPTDLRNRGVAVAVFVMIVILLTGIGYLFYRQEAAEITQEKYQTLSSIGELKSEQIQQWRKERLGEASRAARDALLVGTLTKCLAAPTDQTLRNQLGECLKEEVRDSGVSEPLLLDLDSKLLVSNDEDGGVLTGATREAIRAALDARTAVFSDFYRSASGHVHIDIAAPVYDAGGKNIAILILRNEAKNYLYPLIQSWPTPSRTAEMLLVQRDGEGVVFLNEPRHQKLEALSFRLPLSDAGAPSVQAVLGRQGIFAGKNYQGVEVISDLLPIPETPWFLVVQVDSEEIFAEARSRAILISLIVALFVLLAASLIIMFYRQRQAQLLSNLLESERQRADEQKEILKIESRQRDILQAAMDGYCLVDLQGHIREANREMCEMLGYSQTEILSLTLSDLEVAMSPEVIAANIQLVLTLGKNRFESRHRRKDGGLIDVEVSIQYRPSEGVIVAFHHDITQRKRDEQLLEMRALALEKANTELQVSLERANDLAIRAEAAARAKSEFLAVMSHELRTPLNGVLGFAELLSISPLDEEQLDSVRTIRVSGEHLLGIVNDILDFSSIEKGELFIESAPLVLADLLESSCAPSRNTAAGKGLEFRCETLAGVPREIRGDVRRMRQILINLVGNAVKFTSQGSVILRVGPASTAEGEFLDFSVSDTGPGIPEEAFGFLFMPFMQLDSTLRRQFEGTGLGLAISQRLAETMDGKITVVSTPGRGSTFTLRLPGGHKIPAGRHPAPAQVVPDAPAYGGLGPLLSPKC